ncbi:carbonic anhydrase [Methylomonas paludis]|uniref:carbonic anhydrase n=1 Tax=Methylomonas paludis TaxID=1173101 RepID=A0A975MLN5_9GAMM|nr:carbonic anhydrase [Methylomonas paludis]QWF70102.1 carbonic anhydrase [Methylomonas paludis]
MKSIFKALLLLGLNGLLVNNIYAEGHNDSASSEQSQIHAAVTHVLKANHNFVDRHKSDYFLPFVKGQKPKATVVTCADSRVHSHAIDPHPDGDLFMVRDIGNQVATAKGSIEYGIRHLHTPLLLIVGHSMCGAVRAAMTDYSKLEPAIKDDLSTIHVSKGNPEDLVQVKDAVEANVNQQVAFAVKLFQPELEQGKLIIIGSVYDFRNDYKNGSGRLVFTNVNGETEPQKIKQSLTFSKGVVTK